MVAANSKVCFELLRLSAFIAKFSERRDLPKDTALLPPATLVQAKPAYKSAEDGMEDILVLQEKYKWLLCPLPALRMDHPFKGSKQHLKGR